jgi:arylamine N-acetyltransferase
MPDVSMTTPERDRYLRVLGVARREPGLGALAELTAAHVIRVPFENLSKLLRYHRSGFRGIPDLATVLDDVEAFHLGGTCYSNNFHLYRLLKVLGYEVTLCGADMSRPDVHLVSLVLLEGREYLVDAGYGAPFLDPLPRDLNSDHTIVLGAERYVLRPRDSAGRSRLDLHRIDGKSHSYEVNPAPRRIDEFRQVIEESFAPSATFMNALTIARFHRGRSIVLRHLSLIESEGHRSRVQRLPDASHLPGTIEETFGIPGTITREVLSRVPLSHDPWS